MKFNIALFLSSFCSVSAGQTHQPRYDPTMNISKAFSLLLALAARATNAQRDRDIEKSTNMIEWNDAWDDLEDDGGDGSQNIFEGGSHNIFGGDFIEPGSRPWLVPVAGKYFCGGSLISPSAVMTAAHCVIDPYWGEWYVNYDFDYDYDVTILISISHFTLIIIINNNVKSLG